MPEGNQEQHQEKRPFFLPKTELHRIQGEIDRINERAQERGRLRPQDERRIKNLTGIKRRDFLKKAGVAAAGALTLGTTTIGVRELMKELEPKNELVVWTKSLIERYNAQLEGLKGSDETQRIDATAEFLEMYNKSRPTISLPEELPLLSKEDLSESNLASFNKKLEPLFNALKAQGYFLMASPTTGEWKGAPLSFMALLLGKVLIQESRETQKGGEKSKYNYILIDKDSPAEPERLYIAAPLDVSAMTFKKESGMAVLQRVSAYRESAKNTYDRLQGRVPARTEGDMMKNLVLNQFRNMPEQQAISTIQNLYLETSLRHEERHVLDKIGTEMQGIQLDEHQLNRRVVAEMRGIISPISEANPKVALSILYTWKERKDRFGSIVGSYAASILSDVSAKSLRELIILSDQELNVIGEQAMGATDILYDFIFRKGRKLGDPRLQESFDNYMDALHRR